MIARGFHACPPRFLSGMAFALEHDPLHGYIGRYRVRCMVMEKLLLISNWELQTITRIAG